MCALLGVVFEDVSVDQVSYHKSTVDLEVNCWDYRFNNIFRKL